MVVGLEVNDRERIGFGGVLLDDEEEVVDDMDFLLPRGRLRFGLFISWLILLPLVLPATGGGGRAWERRLEEFLDEDCALFCGFVASFDEDDDCCG